MKTEFLQEAPPIIREFLTYIDNVQGRASLTVDEYYRDLRTFFRYIIKERGLVSAETEFEDIDISNVDIEMVRSIAFSDIISFFYFCKEDRKNKAAARARKTTSLKRYFNYLVVKIQKLEYDPTEALESPKKGKSLPKYLTLEESLKLLQAVDGEFRQRDYCILVFFLNCGMRLSELIGINLGDINSEHMLKIRGKGNKERIVYLNDACVRALDAYMQVRPVDGVKDKNALFISRNKNRISRKAVQQIVYNNLKKIGLDGQGYSVHKLRHTAATLMYQNGGVDVRTLQVVLGHENLGTTQIYTHIADRQVKEAIEANPLNKI